MIFLYNLHRHYVTHPHAEISVLRVNVKVVSALTQYVMPVIITE